MDPKYNNRTYAIIPVAQTTLHVKSNVEHGRLSIDRQFLIWDQDWKPNIKNSLKADSTIKLLNHKEALALMQTPAWKKKEPTG